MEYRLFYVKNDQRKNKLHNVLNRTVPGSANNLRSFWKYNRIDISWARLTTERKAEYKLYYDRKRPIEDKGGVFWS